MLGLSQLGILHTVIGLIAVIAAVLSFIRAGKIMPSNWLGRVYIGTTIVACLTSFGIFAQGKVNEAHMLGILTLFVLALAIITPKIALFGRAKPYIETIAYSTTFFFHWIPGITETTTRFPTSAPLMSGRDDPALAMVIGTVFIVYMVGIFYQAVVIRRDQSTPLVTPRRNDWYLP